MTQGLLANHVNLSGVSSLASRQFFKYTFNQISELLESFNSSRMNRLTSSIILQKESGVQQEPVTEQSEKTEKKEAGESQSKSGGSN